MHSLIGVWPPETSPIINWSKLVEKINKASGIQVLPEIPPRMIPQTHIWDLVTRKKIFHLPNAYCLAISADDATMATQTESYDIELWDIPPRRNWFFAMALAILPTMLITFLAYFLTRHIRFAFTRVAALFQSIRIAK